MKYAIIIPDGAADEPLEELGGKTPLEAAKTPNMDRVALEGRQGLVRTVPDGFESGSDVATMCLLGYDPNVYHTGRAPLEAAAQNIPLSPTDWVFRCNLVTVVDGIMKDHSAGGITDAEAQKLIGDLSRSLKLEGFQFYTGVSYRNLLVYRGTEQFDVKTKPPHEFPDEPVSRYLPKGTGQDILRKIMDDSRELFANHEINEVRKQTGNNPASQVWLWGQGHAPAMPTFKQRFGVNKAAMITGVDLLRGLAVLMGWENLTVEGMTSFHDTNYAGQGQATAAALDKYDLVFSHIEAPDEASHQADWKTKIDAIEHIDQYVVGPVLEKLKQFPEWRLLVMPDHPTNISTRKHGYAPSPFAMAGTRVRSNRPEKYSEKNAAASDLKIERGHELMEYFLRGGKSLTLNFTLTIEDYREANGGTKQPPKTSTIVGLTITWLVVICAAAVMLFFGRPSRFGAPPPPAASNIARLGAAVVPSLVFSAFIWFVSVRSVGKSLPKPWEPAAVAQAGKRSKGIRRGIFGWALFIFFAIVLFMMLNSPKPRQRPTGGPAGPTTRYAVEVAPPGMFGYLSAFDFLIGAVPWITLGILVLMLGRYAGPRQLSAVWEAQRHLHRPTTMEIDATGVIVTEEMARKTYKWGYFPGFKETENLILLYLSPYSFYMIPKRAFANSADYNMFRGMMLNEVKNGFFFEQTSAFPVVLRNSDPVAEN